MLEFKIDPYSFNVWESGFAPLETEVFVANTINQKEVKYLLTCAIANAIRHVKKFFFKRAEITTEPTVAQQVGEFVTELRRLLRDSEYTTLSDLGFQKLTDTDLWSNIGVPNPRNEYKWKINYHTTDGVQQMDYPQAQVLCENATKMATSDKTMDEEFREINNSLNNLMKETTALDTLIFKAKELNAQAGVVVDNLCSIAEKLNQE